MSDKPKKIGKEGLIKRNPDGSVVVTVMGAGNGHLLSIAGVTCENQEAPDSERVYTCLLYTSPSPRD